MPPKTILRELGRSSFICKACLSSLRRTAPARWSSNSSQAAQSSGGVQATGPKATGTADEAERQKTLKQLGLLLRNEEEPLMTVNYFEQSKGGKLRRLDSAEEFNASLDGDDEIEQQIKELEETFGKAESLIKLVEGAGGKDVIDELKKKYGYDMDIDFDNVATDLMEDGLVDSPSEREDGTRKEQEPIVIQSKDLPSSRSQTRAFIFNRTLQRLATRKTQGKVIDAQIRRKFWKAYTDTRLHLRKKWNVVPKAAWDFLWDFFTAEAADNILNSNPIRMSHAFILSRDMVEAGVELRADQQMLAIEAMFIEGWRDKALQNFRRFAGTLGDKPESFMEYWQLGLRMYCEMGDLERAESVMETITTSPYEKDPRILFPMIRAAAAKSDKVDTAFDYYQKFRAMTYPQITVEDYDQIISYFLSTAQTEHALWIFVEMMTNGHINIRQQKKLAKLPANIANPFFFGKWLMRIIAHGDYDGAERVIGLMLEKGIIPKPMHVNGLIGAWLRSGTAENAAKAERVANAMINVRIQFVKNRARFRGLDTHILLKQSGEGWPAATLETFSLMAENYLQRRLPKKMGELWSAFKHAAIPADTFMLNRLLDSHLHSGKGEEVRQLWGKLSKEYNVAPDSYTFMILWLSLSANRYVTRQPHEKASEIPEARRLFAEMMLHKDRLKQTDDCPFELVKRIMHTLRTLDDKSGMLAAYRALREEFGFQDPKDLPMEIMLKTTDLVQASRNKKKAAQMIEAAKQMDWYLTLGRSLLIQQGKLPKDTTDMPPEIKANEMANFLDWHLQQLAEDRRVIQNPADEYYKAEMEMGINGPNPAADVDWYRME